MRGCVVVFLLALLAGPTVAADRPPKPGSVHHLTSPKHAHPYSLYVPSNYSPRASWPVVISSHGRGGLGKGEIGAWSGLAKKHGFIVACPDMCTATVNRPPTSKLRPEVEDEEVVLSILEAIRGWYRVNGRAVMITGFSGGGNPSYWTGLRHPDLITHICTRGGNFAIQQVPRDEPTLAAGRKTTRVYIFYGDNDHVLILGEGGKPGQAQQAHDALRKAGYEHVKIEMIAGMGHQSRPGLAAAWFGEHLRANKRLFAAGDKADAHLEKARAAVEKRKWKEAVRELGKLRTLEEKAGLRPRAEAELAKVNEAGKALLEAARTLHAEGDTVKALRAVEKIARDFKGLPVEAEAKALRDEWKG